MLGHQIRPAAATARALPVLTNRCHACVSGPYKLDPWQRGVQTNMVANETYWRGKPAFPTVTFRAVPDSATRIADLKTGRADMTRGLSPHDAMSLRGEKGLDIRDVATARVAYLFINAMYGPTKDKRVRQAIAMAVDRDTLITALQQGYAKPVDVVLAPTNFGYTNDVKGWPYQRFDKIGADLILCR